MNTVSVQRLDCLMGMSNRQTELISYNKRSYIGVVYCVSMCVTDMNRFMSAVCVFLCVRVAVVLCGNNTVEINKM